MKKIVLIFATLSLNSLGQINLPISGVYRLHKIIEGDCYDLRGSDLLQINYEIYDDNSASVYISSSNLNFFSIDNEELSHNNEISNIEYHGSLSVLRNVKSFKMGRGLKILKILSVPTFNDKKKVVKSIEAVFRLKNQ